jgi:hypothetical protein
MSATTNIPQSNPENQSQFDQDIARAQYKPQPGGFKSRSYRFDTPMDIDSDGNYCHKLIITRLSDEVVITDENHYSTESLDGAISDWTVQLHIASMSTAMWGKS